ncbi:hypothetical protein [Bradyrhizobium sp. HKCCYLS20291]|uniref:hypothetical protein n=1 Tax=Bradyrhizobium sp. HKCCYLS20291 TaxID=3420766 RepID=UPI003EBAA7EA
MYQAIIKLMDDDNLTEQQKAKLEQLLTKRQGELKQAIDEVNAALEMLKGPRKAKKATKKAAKKAPKGR